MSTQIQNTEKNPQQVAETAMSIGHQIAKRHPKMKPFLNSVKGGIDLIDGEKTQESLQKALNFAKEICLSGKVLLVVGTKVQAKDVVKEFATECNLPFINDRWLGGTLTNVETLKKRVYRLKSLEAQKADGSIAKYTKKEQGKMEKEMVILQSKFGGIKNMDKLPDAILVMDMIKDRFAVKEANERGVIVIAVADTNVNPTAAKYPIYASDDSADSIRYILGKFKDVVLSCKGASAAKPQ